MSSGAIDVGDGLGDNTREHEVATPAVHRLIAAGRAMVMEYGFGGVSVEGVITEAGVSKSTFYNHFESKDALLERVVRAEVDWWGRELRAELTKRGGDDVVERLLAVFELVGERQAEGNAGCVLLSACNAYAHPREPVLESALAGVDRVRTDLRAMVEEAVGGKSESVFEAYWALIVAATSRARVDVETSRRTAERLLRRDSV